MRTLRKYTSSFADLYDCIRELSNSFNDNSKTSPIN